uniref:Uncharacterized protein n=1 Tax=Micrurus spixii TaxID=129469 RepID=A0A2D4MDE9_9SAUR
MYCRASRGIRGFLHRQTAEVRRKPGGGGRNTTFEAGGKKKKRQPELQHFDFQNGKVNPKEAGSVEGPVSVASKEHAHPRTRNGLQGVRGRKRKPPPPPPPK